MKKSRKKFWIIFSSVCAAIILFCSIFAVSTKLKTVTVEFRTRLSQEDTVLPAGILERVKTTADFKMGKSLLFLNFEENISNIEKSNPFVKVEQVVRHFPNVARVYISERIPAYRMRDINDENKWYILDEDFKVLDEVEGDIKAINYGSYSYYEKTMEITPDSITITSYTGEFINDETSRLFLNTIASGIKARTNTISVTKSIKMQKNSSGVYTFTLTMKNSNINDDNGCEIVVVGENNLYKKVLAGVSCFCEETENQETFNLSNKVITIEEIGGKLEGIMKDK